MSVFSLHLHYKVYPIKKSREFFNFFSEFFQIMQHRGNSEKKSQPLLKADPVGALRCRCTHPNFWDSHAILWLRPLPFGYRIKRWSHGLTLPSQKARFPATIYSTVRSVDEQECPWVSSLFVVLILYHREQNWRKGNFPTFPLISPDVNKACYTYPDGSDLKFRKPWFHELRWCYK